MEGTLVSHYLVRRKLGAGGTGIVYLAEDTVLRRNVALKFLAPAFASDSHAMSRLLREARAAGALDHPNIATVFEVGEWQQQPFIAMAFCDGETLKDRLERGRMAIEEAFHALASIAAGLAAAHRLGIVHRDLKPANIILGRYGQVKILDFGLASIASDKAPTTTRLTSPGTVMGTVSYMSPEQIHGQPPRTATDIWAIGVIAYEMLAGRLPFTGDTMVSVALAIQTKEPLALNRLRSDIPESVADLVQQALEKVPERRMISAQDFERVLTGVNPRLPPSAPRPRGSKQRLLASIQARLTR